jgi:hypothetical protein
MGSTGFGQTSGSIPSVCDLAHTTVIGYMACLNTQSPSYTWAPPVLLNTGTNFVSYHVTRTQKSNGVIRGTAFRISTINATCTPPEEPPPPAVDCSLGAGKYMPLKGTTTAELGGTTCVLGCEIKVGRVAVKDAAQAKYIYNGKITGETCTTPPPGAGTEPGHPVEDATPSNEYCATTEGGKTVCVPHDKQNCGYYNDEYTCLPKETADNCIETASGKRFCAPGAPTPPVPDNGTPGVKATPDDRIESRQSDATAPGAGDGTTITTNVTTVYNSTTVAASARGSTTSGASPGTGGKEVEYGDSPEDSDGASASGGAACDAAPVCDGDPVACAILAQQWRARCVDLPSSTELEAALGPIDDGDGKIFGSASFTAPESFSASGWLGSGTCLADYTLDMGSLLGSVSIPFSEWCWLLEVIGVFVMIAAYVSAARIMIGGL